MRIKNDYTGGNHQFEADFYIPSGTSGTSIFQIFGGGGGHATSFMMGIYDGQLKHYHSETLATNALNRWFHLNVIHFTGSRKIIVYLDNKKVFEGQDNGHDNHYFKCGVYSKPERVHKMEVFFKNIKVYTK
eukprot:403368005